jgi:hypothetical protein
MPDALILVFLLGGLFALIALMPDFQGPAKGGWDQQEDDD